MAVHIAAPRPDNGDASRKFRHLSSLERDGHMPATVSCAENLCGLKRQPQFRFPHPQLSLKQQQLKFATVTRIGQEKSYVRL